MIVLMFVGSFEIQAQPPPVAAPWMALAWRGSEDSDEGMDSNPGEVVPDENPRICADVGDGNPALNQASAVPAASAGLLALNPVDSDDSDSD